MSPSPARILLVDDEEALLQTLARAARGCGYEIDTAQDGAQAWERLGASRYDLVVTDLVMPGMGGPELMERIGAEGLATRMIVITGFATLDAAVDCLRKGATDFLVKPFPVEEFLGSVERVLHRGTPPGNGSPAWESIATRYGLTRKETLVLEAFYASGRTNRELAQELSLSPHTVKSHLKAAFVKLGVSSRTQLLQLLRAEA
ncbi:MAG: response regulator transcription factor [Thermodesulfobacteriota bacterium]|jgi:DNA-binding NarL/FixJ family response regulator